MSKLVPVPVARCAAMSVVKGFDTVLRIGWVPALINTVVGMVLESRLVTVAPDSDQVELHFGPIALYMLSAIATQTVFAVGWHRSVLLGETHAGRRFYLRFGKREAIYALAALVVASIAVMGLYALPVATSLMASGQVIPAVVILGAPLMAIFLVARLSLILPMVALDRPADPARSWRAVDGNTWRVVAVLVLVGVPVFVGEYLLVSIVGSVVISAATALGAIGEAVSFVALFVSGLAILALLATILSAVSLLYMILDGDETLRARLPAPYRSFIEP